MTEVKINQNRIPLNEDLAKIIYVKHIAIIVRKRFIFIPILFLGLTAYVIAQDEVPELITDRPDQTESSVVVPHKSLQIETGFLMENTESDLVSQKSFAYNSTLFRYGLLKNFEFRLGIEYLGERLKTKNTGTTISTSGFSPIYTGFKVKIAEEDGWKPEIAFLGGLVLPFAAGEYFRPEYSAPDIRFAFSHTLSDRFSLGYNLGAAWDGETAIPNYFYSASLGAGIIAKLGMFIESYGWMAEEGEAEHLLDAGLTYLVLPNLQFDVSAGIGLISSIDNFISFGLTFRIPE